MDSRTLHSFCRAFAVALLSALGACSAPGVIVDVGYLQSTVTGDAGLSGGLSSVVGTVDFEDSLGGGDPAGSLYGRVEADLSLPRLTVSAFQYDESGVGVLGANFGDITAATNVESTTRIFNAKAALSFDIIELGPVRISPGFALSVLDTDLVVSDLNGFLGSEEFDEVLPVPLLFLQGELDLGYVQAVAEVGGLDVEVQGVDGTFLDAEALLRVRPIDNFEIFVGYRLISADVTGDIDGDGFDADLLLQGWMVGGGVHF